MILQCPTCRESFEWNAPTEVVNTDGSRMTSVETVCVLVVNEAGTDYDPLFFHNNLCAAEWAVTQDIRLTRPSTFPARYYEAIEQEKDPEFIPVVSDQAMTSHNKRMPRSRFA